MIKEHVVSCRMGILSIRSIQPVQITHTHTPVCNFREQRDTSISHRKHTMLRPCDSAGFDIMELDSTYISEVIVTVECNTVQRDLTTNDDLLYVLHQGLSALVRAATRQQEYQ